MKINYNKKYLELAIYIVISCFVVYTFVKLADGFPEIIKNILKYIQTAISIIQPVIVGCIFWYLFHPIVNYFNKKIEKIKILKKVKNKRSLAITLTYIVIIIFVLSLFMIFIFGITDKVKVIELDDLNKSISVFIREYEKSYNLLIDSLKNTKFSEYFTEISNKLIGVINGFGKSTISFFTNLTGYLTTGFLGFLLSIYFLTDEKLIITTVNKISKALLSDKMYNESIILIKKADRVFSGYIKGTSLDMLFCGTAITVALCLLQIKYAILIGIFTGIFNMIPYAGPFVAYVGSVLSCVLTGDYNKIIITIIVLFIVQSIDGNIVGPKLMSNSISIHPVLVIVFLIIGSALFGFLGMVIAVPIGTLLKELFMEYIERRIKHKNELIKNNK